MTTTRQHYRRSPKESDVRGTPPELYRELTGRFGPCDLDVCALPSNTKCELFYSLERGEDGLALPWTGRVYCNPPFSQCGDWTAKARAEISDPASECRSVLMLLPNVRGEQPWWHEHVEPFRDGRFVGAWTLSTYNLERRRRFHDEHGKPIPGSPPFGLVVLHWVRRD